MQNFVICINKKIAIIAVGVSVMCCAGTAAIAASCAGYTTCDGPGKAPLSMLSTCAPNGSLTCRPVACSNGCFCLPDASYCSQVAPGPSCNITWCPISWSASITNGVQTGTLGTLNRTTCTCSTGTSSVKRCAKGYYDANSQPGPPVPAGGEYYKGTSQPIECKPCPKIDGTTPSAPLAGYSSDPRLSNNITTCYIEPSASITDSTGKYSFSSNCPYTT